VTDLTELGHKRDALQLEIGRISRHPAHVHKLTEGARSAQVLELQDELRLVNAEIEQAAQAQQQRHLNQAYGTVPVAENAEAELKLAEAELAKVLASFESQTRGYAKRVHEALVKHCDASNAAGRRAHRSEALNGTGRRLGEMVSHAIRFGN
jgi:hypothetical protein